MNIPIQQHPPRLKTVTIIPCYNVEKFCRSVVIELLEFTDHIIAVNDGSSDKTITILNELASKHSDKITVLSFHQNRGKGFALIKGFEHALHHFVFDVLVTIDSDGQHRPCDIPELIKPIYHHADFVIGERSFRAMPFRSKFANTLISFLLRCVYSKAPKDTQSGMRAFSYNFTREIIHQIPGGHYEMEFKCLLLALEQKRKTGSYTIPTIYIEKNKSSHFFILRDSFKILYVLFSHLFKKKKK